MIELNGMSLGDRIHHIRRFWGTPTEEYKWLKHAHKTFIMDAGLEGNVLTRNYGALGFLVEHSWWKHTWHLCYLYDCELVFDSDYLPTNPRENNRAFIKLLINSGLWSKHHMIILNRMQRFKKIHFFSETLCTDGKTVDPRMLTNRERRSS